MKRFDILLLVVGHSTTYTAVAASLLLSNLFGTVEPATKSTCVNLLKMKLGINVSCVPKNYALDAVPQIMMMLTI